MRSVPPRGSGGALERNFKLRQWQTEVMTFARFDRYVDRKERNFTERLQSLCRMPSVAARGTGMRAMAEIVEQMMQRVGIGTRSLRVGPGYPIISGEFGSGAQATMS